MSKVKRIIEIDEDIILRVKENNIQIYDPFAALLAVENSKLYGSCHDCKKNLEEATHPDCFECAHHYRNKFEPKEGEEYENT